MTQKDAANSAVNLILDAQRAHPTSPMLRARFLRQRIELLGDMNLAEEIFFELIRAALLPFDEIDRERGDD